MGAMSPSPYWTKVQYTSTTFGSIVRSNFLSHALATALQAEL